MENCMNCKHNVNMRCKVHDFVLDSNFFDFKYQERDVNPNEYSCVMWEKKHKAMNKNNLK